MTGVRRAAMGVAFCSWLFSFSLLHDVRSRFGPDGIGALPGWLAGVLGLSLILTLGTAITAGIKLPVWPWLAMASGALVFLSVLAAHLAYLQALSRLKLDVGSPNVLAAFRDGFRAHGLQPVFFLGASTALVVTGIYGWLNGPRHLFVPEEGTNSQHGGASAA